MAFGDRFRELKLAIDALAREENFSQNQTVQFLATLPLSSWAPALFALAWKITQQEADLLQSLPIAQPPLEPGPLAPGTERFISLHPGEGFAVFFEKTAKDALGDIRQFPSSEFLAEPPRWIVYPLQGSGVLLLAFASKHHFHLGPGVEGYAEDIDRDPRPLLCRRISPGTNEKQQGFDLSFPYSERVLNDVREIVGRAFSKIPAPHWWVPAKPYQARNLLDLALAHQFSIEEHAVPSLQELDEQAAQLPPQPPTRRVEYDAEQSCLWVHFPPSKPIFQEMERIPGAGVRSRENGEKACSIPLTSQGMRALTTFLDAHPGFVCNAEVAIQIQRHQATLQILVQASISQEADLEIAGLGGELRPCQRACVHYARLANYQLIIGDEVGIGKTAEALAIIHVTQAFPALIIAPATLKWNWAWEAERWLPGKTTHVLEGTSSKPGDYEADILIMNYDLLAARKSDMLAFFKKSGTRALKSVIADESHFLKNSAAQRTQAALALAENVPVRLALSGTPMLNRPIELVPQLEFTGKLALFGGRSRFARRYCNAHPTAFGWDVNGASNTEELHQLLQETGYIRRLKKDVLAELPPVQVEMVRVDIDNWPEYRQAEDETVEWLREQVVQDRTFLAEIQGLDEELRQILIQQRMKSKEEKARRALHLARIEALKQVAVRGKLASIQSWIDNFLTSGEKLVVFASHIEIQQTLLSFYPDAAHVLGDMKSADRFANVKRFQEDPDCQLIICSLKAAKEGLTLTAASNVALLELGWTPADIDQPLGRVHRQTQEASSVTIWTLLAARTIEVTIAQLIDCKRAVIDSSMDGIPTETQKKSVFGELLALLTQESGLESLLDAQEEDRASEESI